MPKLVSGFMTACLALCAAGAAQAHDGYSYDRRPYDDGYIRSGRDWPIRPPEPRRPRYAGCTVRHVYFDPRLDRYTVVHEPVRCRDDYGRPDRYLDRRYYDRGFYDRP